ncbi:hypothetical protein [uncultured Nitratireductor sp.]|uniref:hypothetical protein n=1 Tax=uncultured Nitratireductor sp. TaxID=520953 RepID=UPI0025CB8689|nr:hypothetical protein [uncultured Nitratireductor sp.]
MKACRRNTSWFDSLRHEARLFAAVGFLSLLMGLLQPLAVAVAAPVSYGFVICTTYGIGKAPDSSREGARKTECPLCLSGHACGFQFSPATPQLPVLAPPAWARDGTVLRPWGEQFWTTPTSDTPPSIRAPPVFT